MNVTFLDDVENKYPKVLLENRPIVEGNVVGMIWKNLDILNEYRDLDDKMFKTYDGRFYFNIAMKMKELGFSTIDAISIETYLSERPAIKEKFNSKGGFNTINSLAILLNEENMHKFYDDLIKSEIILGLHLRGFDVVSQIQLLKNMTSDDLYNHFDLLLNDLFIKKSLDLETADLTDNYDSFLQDADSGQNMGLSYKKAGPIMNYQTAGVRKGCTIVASTTSGGKSSLIAHHYILNFVEQGKKVVLIINEEDESAWRSLILTTVINTRIRHYDETSGKYTQGMSRKRFLEGKFTPEEWELIRKAQEWLKQYPNGIEYVKTFDYKVETVKKIISKYKNLGYSVVMLDTFKAADGGSENSPAWKQMLDASKTLFQATSKADMYLIITAQVALRYNSIRKLDCSHLGGATQISEIADTVVIFRDAWTDEVDSNSNKFLAPYKFLKGDNGKYTSTRQMFDLEPNSKYAIFFLAKARGGEKGAEILYKKDIAFNSWRELGYCNVAQF